MLNIKWNVEKLSPLLKIVINSFCYESKLLSSELTHAAVATLNFTGLWFHGHLNIGNFRTFIIK